MPIGMIGSVEPNPEEAERRVRFGEALRKAMEVPPRITQTRLANRLAVNQTTISAWLRGEKMNRVTPGTVSRIEAALGADRCAPGFLAEILFGPFGPADPDVPAYVRKIARLSPSKRAVIERLVDEMLGPDQ